MLGDCLRNDQETLVCVWTENRVLVRTEKDKLVIRKYRKEDDRWIDLETLYALNNRFGELILDFMGVKRL